MLEINSLHTQVLSNGQVYLDSGSGLCYGDVEIDKSFKYTVFLV